jgi:hypothetical protein
MDYATNPFVALGVNLGNAATNSKYIRGFTGGYNAASNLYALRWWRFAISISLLRICTKVCSG